LKKLFFSVSALDATARSRYGLSEELMMEHAALAIKNDIVSRFAVGSSVLIIVGSGNNGADGYALARLLYGYDVTIFEVGKPKSELCKLQQKMALQCDIKIVSNIQNSYDVVVDAIFGSGLSKPLDLKTSKLISKLNRAEAYKIACDIPTGLFADGSGETVFEADLTVTMGASKTALYSDFAKDFVGRVVTADLGVSSGLYEEGFAPDAYLLERSDLRLPTRTDNSSHKGNFGHLAVFAGDKRGAAMLCGLGALAFGCGLVTLVGADIADTPCELMYSCTVPKGANTAILGPGMGERLDDIALRAVAKSKKSFVIDADMFYRDSILDFLALDNTVITPHPKEFASLLSLARLANIDASTVQARRFELAKLFSQNYPSCTLVLKGANTIIAQGGELFVCTLGSVALAKGGSGDVLAGLIGALLAQGYESLEAAKSGVLAHALASQDFKNNYALTPLALIEKIKEL